MHLSIVYIALLVGFVGMYCKVSKCNPEIKCKTRDNRYIVICLFNKQEKGMIMSLSKHV
jgi:hypothetical protein